MQDEAQKIAGKDIDFHRNDLYTAIENGDYPEYELGVQIVSEEDQDKFDFDLLDATKLIPESLVPVTKLGKMVLNRNPDNYFSETEQVTFHPGHIVRGRWDEEGRGTETKFFCQVSPLPMTLFYKAVCSATPTLN